MGEVVQLFKTVSEDEAKATIIDNLKEMHHCKWVNYWCAVRGLEDFEQGHKTLNLLIAEGIVDIHMVQGCAGTLYRYDVFNDLTV